MKNQNAQHIDDGFTAGVILESGVIQFVNTRSGMKLALDNRTKVVEYKSIGTVLKVCHDKNQ